MEDGYITRLTGYSGHFLPGIQNIAHAIIVLDDLGANLEYLKRFYVLEKPEINTHIKKTSDNIAYIDAKDVLDMIDNEYGPDSTYKP